jgi:hypothetical protein
MKTTVSSDGVARRSGPTEWPDGVARRSGPTGWPDGVAGTQRRAHGRLTEGGSRGVADGGSRGWPDGGLYKSAWPTFLGTLLRRPVSPARNAGA